MNKLLWGKVFSNKIDSMKVEDESATIFFEGAESINFSTHHDQDCCESVYGDFSIVKYHEDRLVGKDITKIEVKAVEEMGFLICFNFQWQASEKIFIPCYNSQNGWYSSDLELTIDDNGTKTTIDISGYVEDDIN